MTPRISMITLGVADVARARAFYEALGWRAAAASQDSIAFMTGGAGPVLGLFGREALADDAALTDAPTGFAAVALAANYPDRAAVDAFFALALAAGARALKAPEPVFWGGYSGYFKDLDDHVWEVAHNPFAPLTEDGRMILDEKEAAS